MTFFDPASLRLYLVLDPDLCGGAEGMIRTTQEALLGGVSFVQLRAPRWKKRAMAECARALLEVTRDRGVPLVIDDHADVAFAVNADGVHVGQQDLAVEDCRRLLGTGKIVGLSINTSDEMRRAPVDLVDYVGIGPVFHQMTKLDASPALGLEGLRTIVEMSSLPSVAIGGIKAENTRAVMATGVDGIAVVSAVCGTRSPRDAAASLRSEIDR